VKQRSFRVGVDFDNTIVSYDDLIRKVAIEGGLIDRGGPMGKKAIRDRIRERADGDIDWQKIQGLVYGPRMGEARIIAGVAEFFARCRSERAEIFIVSHKTEYANFDPTRTPLRGVALSWMQRHGFFSTAGLGLSTGDIHFATTRQEKVECIAKLGCSHFIDDLEEVFAEASFPTGVLKILYAPDVVELPSACDRIARSWPEITCGLFDARE
jgi:hypothetical protein